VWCDVQGHHTTQLDIKVLSSGQTKVALGGASKLQITIYTGNSVLMSDLVDQKSVWASSY